MVESNPSLYLSAWADGSWSVQGVADEGASIVCDSVGHDNHTNLLDKSMTAFLETILPGTTWQGSNPQHPLGEDVVVLHVSAAVYDALRARADDLLTDAIVVRQGEIQ